MKTTRSLKTVAFALGLAAMMVPATTLNAQDRPGGLFGTRPEGLFGTNAPTEQSQGGLMGDRTGSSTSFNIGTGQFGGNGGQEGGDYGISIGVMGQDPDAPLGSGLFIMAAAGAAYAFSKKRKKQEVRR